jgi:hypothetical protein
VTFKELRLPTRYVSHTSASVPHMQHPAPSRQVLRLMLSHATITFRPQPPKLAVGILWFHAFDPGGAATKLYAPYKNTLLRRRRLQQSAKKHSAKYQVSDGLTSGVLRVPRVTLSNALYNNVELELLIWRPHHRRQQRFQVTAGGHTSGGGPNKIECHKSPRRAQLERDHPTALHP